MPTLFTIGGNRFFFYSNEGNEPPHVHIENAERTAKIWLADGTVAKNYGFNQAQISNLVHIVTERRDEIMNRWAEHFGQ